MSGRSSTATFATCSYTEFQLGTGIPVRSTAGHPRFRLRYQMAATWPQATPSRAWLTAPEAIFRDQYRAKLDAFGAERLAELAAQLRAATGGDGPVVLLCFDKLWQPDTWCHRTMFGEWWEERTGEEVPELGATTEPPSVTRPSPTRRCAGAQPTGPSA